MGYVALTLAGYVLVVAWAIRILVVNHINRQRRLISWVTLGAASVWVAYFALFVLYGGEPDKWMLFCQAPTVAAFLLVMQTVRLGRD